jgi:hypothetical protein
MDVILAQLIASTNPNSASVRQIANAAPKDSQDRSYDPRNMQAARSPAIPGKAERRLAATQPTHYFLAMRAGNIDIEERHCSILLPVAKVRLPRKHTSHS